MLLRTMPDSASALAMPAPLRGLLHQRLQVRGQAEVVVRVIVRVHAAQPDGILCLAFSRRL
jgi:hypothetical protein